MEASILFLTICLAGVPNLAHFNDDYFVLLDNRWIRKNDFNPGSQNYFNHRVRNAAEPFLGNDDDDAVAYEDKLRDWLEIFNDGYRKIRHDAALVNWNYNTNITVANAERVADQGVHRAVWMQSWREEATKVDARRIRDHFLRRQVAFIRRGSSHTNSKLTWDVIRIHSKMQEIYNTGQVCVTNGSCYTGEPQLTRFMQTSRDYNQLLWAWQAWRDAVGPPLRPLYAKFVELSNQEAKMLGYSDMGQLWRQEIDSDNLESKVEQLFSEVRPLYLQLHAFIRHHLVRIYGKNRVSERGPIPAHILGNMWAQQWDSLYPYVIPYPDYNIPDVTAQMVKQKYTTHRMFRLAEDFFLSIGLESMTKEFWTRSLLDKTNDGRRMSCHGSATNFFDGKDYRIRMCTEITEQDLYTVHHEMGHVEYFMAYRHLPVLFQDGANSAFHEAIGETIHYSVLTPIHLQRLKLLKHVPITYEMDINFLMKQALLKIPLLPFSLLMDTWRWGVFSHHITEDEYNERWWALRLKYQGIKPPVTRTADDFDPGSKYHIPDNTPYIRYYLSSFMQVQFHEALCRARFDDDAVEYLHQCDIYGSKKAGEKLRAMLSVGTSQPWPDTLEMLTGKRHVSAKSLLRYYAPLYDWLVQENRRLGNHIGWDDNWLTNDVDGQETFEESHKN